MSESVVPCKQFEYNETFMGMVDTVFKPQTETVPVPEANGIHIYLCLFRSNNNSGLYHGFYKPRENIINTLSEENKKKMRRSTNERTIKIGAETKSYFLSLFEIDDLQPHGIFSSLSSSKNMDDGESAESKYGRIYDFILYRFTDNNSGCIIYAANIESADKLFKEAVKKGTITLDNIQTDATIQKKYRKSIDNQQKQRALEAEAKDAKDKAGQIEEESKARGKSMQDAIASIQNIHDLTWRVFTIHDIGDILQLKENNKFYPRFSKPVPMVKDTALWYNSNGDLTNAITANNENSQMENYKIYNVIDNQVKQNAKIVQVEPVNYSYPDHNIAPISSIPEGFSWVKKINESTSIHVIKLKAFDPLVDRSTLTSKYIILGHKNENYGTIVGMSYEVTIETLTLVDDKSSDEIKFKKRILTPFIDNDSDNILCYFVLNATDENEALVYFLRKYGIHCIRSPVENRFTFEFTHVDYIATRKYSIRSTDDLLITFGYNPLTLFSAVSVVHVCLKNDKLLSTDPSSQSNSGSTPTQEVSAPTPEVLVLSQLTKDKIKRATSVHYVLEINTDHRTKKRTKKIVEKYDFGIIDGFGGKVVMHETSWSLGCVESILDQPECTNYNELNLAAKGNKDGFKSYLSTGTFPEGFVSRGSDDWDRLVALEPYGNLFSSGDIIPEPANWWELHPVFYVFNALNKESAVIAFKEKLAGEINNVINNDDSEIQRTMKILENDKTNTKKHDEFYLATRNVLNNNPFLKIFKTFKYKESDMYGHLLDKPSITPFVDSIIGGNPDTSLLIPETIEIVSKPKISKGGKSSKKRTKKSRRNKVRSNKRATRSNKRKHNNTRKK